MATVVNPKLQTYAVKNLGWLRRHLSVSVVEHIEVSSYDSLHGQPQFLLEVYFEDGYQFQEVFSSYINLKDWLSRRRALAGVKLIWFGEVKDPDWQRQFTKDVAAYLLSLLPW